MVVMNSSVAATIDFAGANNVARRAGVSSVVVVAVTRSIAGAVAVIISPVSPR